MQLFTHVGGEGDSECAIYSALWGSDVAFPFRPVLRIQ